MASLLLKLTNTNAGRSISHAVLAFFGALLPMLDLTNVSGLHATLIAAIPAALAVAFRSLSPSLHPAGTQVSVVDVEALIKAEVAKAVAPWSFTPGSGAQTISSTPNVLLQSPPTSILNINSTDTTATPAPDVQIVDTDTPAADAPA